MSIPFSPTSQCMGRLHDHHIAKNMFQASAVCIGVYDISHVHLSQLAMAHRLFRKDFDVISVICTHAIESIALKWRWRAELHRRSSAVWKQMAERRQVSI